MQCRIRWLGHVWIVGMHSLIRWNFGAATRYKSRPPEEVEEDLRKAGVNNYQRSVHPKYASRKL